MAECQKGLTAVGTDITDGVTILWLNSILAHPITSPLPVREKQAQQLQLEAETAKAKLLLQLEQESRAHRRSGTQA